MKLFQAVKTCGEIANAGLSEGFFAEDCTETPDNKIVKNFVLAAKFVVDELFCDGGASVVSLRVNVKDNKVNLPQNCKVLSVTDGRSNNRPFTYVDGGLSLENGEAVVNYALPHAEFNWRDELPVPNNGTNDRVLIYGMMSEFFLLQGDGEQAATWRARFEDCLNQFGTKRRCGNLPVGRWFD